MNHFVSCDQVLYMPARVGLRKGYQVVGSSAHVSPEETSFIEAYGIPITADINGYRECRRLFRLPSGRIGANYVKNIEIGYDGRLGAFLSRTIIIEEEKYLNLGADPAIFDPVFSSEITVDNVGGLKSTVVLSELTVEEIATSLDLRLVRSVAKDEASLGAMLETILDNRRRLVLITDSNEDLSSFVRSLVIMLPDRLRLVEYSTFTSDPSREIQFNLMLMRSKYLDGIVLSDDMRLIDLTKPTSQQFSNSVASKLGSILSSSVFKNDSSDILKLRDLFSRYPSSAKRHVQLEFLLEEFSLSFATEYSEKADRTLKLAEMRISTQLSNSYYEQAKNFALMSGDKNRIVRAFGSCLAFEKMSKDINSFLDLYERELNWFLQNFPESAPGFAENAMKNCDASNKFSFLLVTVRVLQASNHEISQALLEFAKRASLVNDLVFELQRSKNYDLSSSLFLKSIKSDPNLKAGELLKELISNHTSQTSWVDKSKFVEAVMFDPDFLSLQPSGRLELLLTILEAMKAMVNLAFNLKPSGLGLFGRKSHSLEAQERQSPDGLAELRNDIDNKHIPAIKSQIANLEKISLNRPERAALHRLSSEFDKVERTVSKSTAKSF